MTTDCFLRRVRVVSSWAGDVESVVLDNNYRRENIALLHWQMPNVKLDNLPMILRHNNNKLI